MRYYLPYAYTQSDIKIPSLEQKNVNKTINGERNVSKDIIAVYETAGNLSKLEEGVSGILEDIIDKDYIREQLNKLLWQDSEISYEKRKELSENNDSLEQFIAKCIIFGMSRKFMSRVKKTNDYSTKFNFFLSEYLLDYHFPSVSKVFCGRAKDLEEIYQRLMKTPHLFLTGIGGIGKSELAKQYGKRFKKEYEHIIYLRYNESLHRTIYELDFVDDTQDMDMKTKFDMHYRFFKRLGSDTLVILDNFDSIPEQEILFYDFLSLSFQLLVTTRNIIDDVPCYEVEEIESMEELAELFYAYALASKEKPDLVRDIIEEVYKHTLTVEMAAKTMVAANLTPIELLHALKAEGLKLSNPNKIKIIKDAQAKKRLFVSPYTDFI